MESRIFKNLPTVNLGKQHCEICHNTREAAIGFLLESGMIYWCRTCMKIKELEEQIKFLKSQ
jgi:hypothetical protein